MADLKDISKQKISQVMTPLKAGQFLLLGLLWLLGCIPVITAGASTCAVFYVGIKILNDEPGLKICRLFFKGIKQNFVQGLLMFLISIITLGGLGALIVWAIISEQSLFIIVLAACCGFVAFVFNVFAYPLIARYENSFVNVLRNVIALMFTYLTEAVKLCVILAVYIAIDVLLFRLNLIAGFVSLLFWPSVIFYTICYRLFAIFYKVEHPIKYDENGDPISE
ncbi:MAG: DUF624 domain-containing protein [Treponema sp.]|nr:DUF624 domain-containing protein [Treponema sp.]